MLLCKRRNTFGKRELLLVRILRTASFLLPFRPPRPKEERWNCLRYTFLPTAILHRLNWRPLLPTSGRKVHHTKVQYFRREPPLPPKYLRLRPSNSWTCLQRTVPPSFPLGYDLGTYSRTPFRYTFRPYSFHK